MKKFVVKWYDARVTFHDEETILRSLDPGQVTQFKEAIKKKETFVTLFFEIKEIPLNVLETDKDK